MTLLSRTRAIVLGIVAVLGFVVALLASGFRAGRTSQKAKDEKHHREDAEEANDIKDKQLEAAANRPRDRDELVERMRDRSF